MNNIFNDIKKNAEFFELYYQKEKNEHSNLIELEDNCMEVDKKHIVRGKKNNILL